MYVPVYTSPVSMNYTCFLTTISADPVNLFNFARFINEVSLVSRKQEHLVLCFLASFVCSVNFLLKSFRPFLGLGVFSSLSYVQTLSKLGKVALYVTFVLFHFLSSNE